MTKTMTKENIFSIICQRLLSNEYKTLEKPIVNNFKVDEQLVSDTLKEMDSKIQTDIIDYFNKTQQKYNHIKTITDEIWGLILENMSQHEYNEFKYKSFHFEYNDKLTDYCYDIKCQCFDYTDPLQYRIYKCNENSAYPQTGIFRDGYNFRCKILTFNNILEEKNYKDTLFKELVNHNYNYILQHYILIGSTDYLRFYDNHGRNKELRLMCQCANTVFCFHSSTLVDLVKDANDIQDINLAHPIFGILKQLLACQQYIDNASNHSYIFKKIESKQSLLEKLQSFKNKILFITSWEILKRLNNHA